MANDTQEKRLYVRITAPDGKGPAYICAPADLPSDIEDWLFDGGDEPYLMAAVYMTPDEFMALPNFDGF